MGTSRRHPLAGLLMVLTGYLVLITGVLISDPRYHDTLIPLAVIFSAKGWLEERPMLWRGLRAHEVRAQRQLLAWGATVAAFVALLVLKFLERQTHMT